MAERADYLTLATKLGRELGDPWQGLRYVSVAFFQSPHFLHFIEQGEPERPDRFRYTGYELLLVVVRACDLTRVFSVMVSTAGSGQAGAMNGRHPICHDDPPELGSNLLWRRQAARRAVR